MKVRYNGGIHTATLVEGFFNINGANVDGDDIESIIVESFDDFEDDGFDDEDNHFSFSLKAEGGEVTGRGKARGNGGYRPANYFEPAERWFECDGVNIDYAYYNGHGVEDIPVEFVDALEKDFCECLTCYD